MLAVSSTPSRAAVTVDGRSAGVTPIVVTLEPGKHQVRIELEGHHAVTSEVEVHSNERSSILVPLPPADAAAAPKSAPAPAVEPLRSGSRPA
jgi:hypothetical protein